MNSKTRDKKDENPNQDTNPPGSISKMSSNANENGCECKISRNSLKYNLTELYRKLPDLWLGKGTEEHSLRELQEKINIEILRSALEKEGVDTVVGETEARYEVLTDDSYSPGEKTEVASRLRSEGVDVDEVRSDFVSHQSVANHFNGCLGITKDENRGSKENDIRNIRSLEKIAKDRLEQMVEKHRKRGETEVPEEYRVEADFYVVDEDGEKMVFDEIVGKT